MKAIRICTGLAALAALAATPVRADSPERLSWLSTMTDRAEWGVQLAREQLSRNELLEALSTLERVLANHPNEKDAHLLHAGLLCRAGDPEGAAMEFGRLRQRDFDPAAWAEANARCQGIAVREQ